MQDKRWKCIKKYPNGPEVGTIYTSDAIYTKHKILLDWKGTSIFPEEYPDYWQEIKEVKLEVPIGTKFKISEPFLEDGKIYTLKRIVDDCVEIGLPNKSFFFNFFYSIEKVNQYFKDGSWTVHREKENEFEVLEFTSNSGVKFVNNIEGFNHIFEELLKTKEIDKIIKIKRLSDGVIFNVGDKVYWENFGKAPFATIEKIFIHSNDILRFKFKEDRVGEYENLCYLKHYKQFIFFDELGNEVFEGDTYCAVGTEFNVFYTYCNNKTTIDKRYFKYFKNTKDCDKYISDNKPTFSRKQVRNILHGFDKEVNEYEDIGCYDRFIDKYK